ncbi:MAG: MiaB/RimO family radical SAM methylthiotransferase [Rectinemataceae bacterium]
MELRVAFHTLGCKLNQLETESLADSFRAAGAWVQGSRTEAAVMPPGGSVVPPGGSVMPPGGPILIIVNTCTVTGKAEQKARRIVRQALGQGPGDVALVTGCYAQLEAEALSELHERAVIVRGDMKAALLTLPAFLAREWQGHGDLLEAVLAWRRQAFHAASGAGSGSGQDDFAFLPEEFSFHSRPSLKIEDGCDNRCSYCRVCLARGPSRSLPVAQVLSRLCRLEEAGKAEAVLTGVNLFQYRDGDIRFPGLLRALLEGTSSIALRLSSYEPEGINYDFLDAFADPRVRPHIHLPVQSGSDSILASMARGYRREAVLRACGELRRVRDDPFIAADMITGFPGEEDAQFAESLELAQACAFSWIHVFPFSARPGTAAVKLLPKVPERVAGERAHELGELARVGRSAYIGRQEGRVVEAVVETAGARSGGGLPHATTENYLKVAVRGLPRDTVGGYAIRCRLGAPLEGRGRAFTPWSGSHAGSILPRDPRPVPVPSTGPGEDLSGVDLGASFLAGE